MNALAVAPNGRHLFSASDDRTVRQWSTASGEASACAGLMPPRGVTCALRQLLRTIAAHSRPVSALALSQDGLLLYSGSYDNTVKQFSTDSGEVGRGTGAPRIRPANAAVMFLVFRAACAQHGGACGRHQHALSLAWRPCALLRQRRQNRPAVDGKRQRGARIVKLESPCVRHGVCLCPCCLQLTKDLDGHGGAVTALALTPDGTLLVSASTDGTVKLWTAASGEVSCLPPVR